MLVLVIGRRLSDMMHGGMKMAFKVKQISVGNLNMRNIQRSHPEEIIAYCRLIPNFSFFNSYSVVHRTSPLHIANYK
jgi:hypothetical protein